MAKVFNWIAHLKASIFLTNLIVYLSKANEFQSDSFDTFRWSPGNFSDFQIEKFRLEEFSKNVQNQSFWFLQVAAYSKAICKLFQSIPIY